MTCPYCMSYTDTAGKCHNPDCPKPNKNPVFTSPAQTGWICPNCGVANSPTVNQCPCGPRTTTTTGTNVNVP